MGGWGVKGVFMMKFEREREGERVSHVACGSKGQTTGVLGYVYVARTWWEPSPLGLLFYVGPPIDNMDPPSFSSCQLFSLSLSARLLSSS